MNSHNEYTAPTRDSTELLNSLVYTHYGVLHNSHSTHLSKANNLAVATNKCLLLLNYNFDWPSSLNHTSAVKYFQKQRTAAAAKLNSSMASTNAWIQDLHECKNDAFVINVLWSVPRSKIYTDLFKQFFKLDELSTMRNKRKSFLQHIRHSVTARQNKSPDAG
jgi:hypothetical protein